MVNPLRGTKFAPPKINPIHDDADTSDWPVCRVRGCGEEYPPGRGERGYTTCHKHSARDPMNSMPPLLLQEVNKSNPSVTRRTDFIADAYQDRKVRMPLRQNRSYVQLGSYSGPKESDDD